MITDDIFLKIVSNAVKAPSGHNTQPWLFNKEAESIIIMPDFKRALPVADPQNRELYISLGCAAENVMLVAKFYGYNSELNFDLLNSEHKIRIGLTKNEQKEEPYLFSFINIRQTTRNLYNNTSVTEADLLLLKETVSEPGFDVKLYVNKEEKNNLIPYIFDANSLQMSNLNFKNELINWLRFSEKEALKKGDGLYSACSGMPAVGKTIGNFVFKNFVTVKSEEKRLQKQLDATPVLVMFTSPNDNVEDWINTGIFFQRFGLTATKLELSLSHLNLPCQVTQVRNKMRKELGLDGAPQLLIRLGYSKKMDYSLRRRLNEVLLSAN